MADEWDKFVVGSPASGTKDEWEQYAQQTPQQNNVSDSLLGVGVGIPAVAGVGYGLAKGAIGLKNYWQAPSNLLSPIESELSQMTKTIPSMKGMRYQDIPQRIRGEMAENRVALKDFDDFVLSNSAENLASSAKEAYPAFKQANHNAYAEMIKRGEFAIEKSGKPLNTLSFDKEIIQKSIDELKNKLTEEELNKLKPILKGEANESTLKFGEAKKYIENLKKELPSEAQRTINKNWGKYLESNAPPEVASDLISGNRKYADFIKQDEALTKLIDPKTGNYDYDKLYRYTIQRAKTRINDDFQKLMSGLSEVSPDVGVKAKDLYQLRAKRISMQRSLNSMRAWLTKAEELVSKRAELFEKYPHRLKGAGKLLGEVGKTAGRALIFKGLPSIALGTLDPAFAVYRGETGLDPMQAIDVLRKGGMNEEEKRKFLESQAI